MEQLVDKAGLCADENDQPWMTSLYSVPMCDAVLRLAACSDRQTDSNAVSRTRSVTLSAAAAAADCISCWSASLTAALMSVALIAAACGVSGVRCCA